MKKLLLLAFLLPIQAYASTLNFLEIKSNGYSYLTQGEDYYYTEQDGTFQANQSFKNVYQKQTVALSFREPNWNLSYPLGGDSWIFHFNTLELGELTPGVYETTDIRSSLYTPSSPYYSLTPKAVMDISANSRAGEFVEGEFVLHDIDFGENGLVNRFAASFKQYFRQTRDVAVYGRISYNSNAFHTETNVPTTDVPEPSVLSLLLLGFTGIGIRKFRKP